MHDNKSNFPSVRGSKDGCAAEGRENGCAGEARENGYAAEGAVLLAFAQEGEYTGI